MDTSHLVHLVGECDISFLNPAAVGEMKKYITIQDPERGDLFFWFSF